MALRPTTRLTREPGWTELNTLSCVTLGSSVLFATDDWFAAAENLLSPEPAVWREGFTEQGKWMDGWETRRKRIPGHDWCLIRLGLPGLVHGLVLDTSFFTGNFAPRASVQAANLSDDAPVIPGRSGDRGVAASSEQTQAAESLGSDQWHTLVQRTELGAGYEDTCRSYFTVEGSRGPFTHIRLNIFPDGGVARLRVFGVAVARPLASLASGACDLVSVTGGGLCLGYSDAHYGHPRNIIKPGPGINMGDGWETARRLDRPAVLEADPRGILAVPGHEWAVFRLGLPGSVTEIQVDTNHFKGNYPDSCLIEWTELEAAYPEDKAALIDRGGEEVWRPLLPPAKLGPHKLHQFPRDRLEQHGRVTHIRVKMFPDGGISRIRLIGTPAS